MNCSFTRSVLVAFAAFTVASGVAWPAVADPAANIIAGPAGGHIVIARSTATTPLAALHASGRAFGGYLGAAPVIESVAESRDGRAMYATFRSAAAGTPLVGVIVAATVHGGTQLVALADRPDRIRTSFGPMLDVVQGHPASQNAGAPVEPLQAHGFPDQSGTVSLPADWKIAGSGQGQVEAHGPNGEAAFLGIGPLIVDPRAGLQAQVQQQSGGLVLPYSPDPRVVFAELQATAARRAHVSPDVRFIYAKQIPSSGFTAMAIKATETGTAGPETVMGVIGVSQMTMGGYTIYLQVIAAPTSRLEREMATLTAIYDSYRVNGAVRGRQVQDSEHYAEAFSSATIANIHAVGAASIAAARASDAAMDRSTSGFVHYLNGSDVIENLDTGEHASVDEGWAQSLARDDPQNFRVVPMTEYRAGD